MFRTAEMIGSCREPVESFRSPVPAKRTGPAAWQRPKLHFAVSVVLLPAWYARPQLQDEEEVLWSFNHKVAEETFKLFILKLPAARPSMKS